MALAVRRMVNERCQSLGWDNVDFRGHGVVADLANERHKDQEMVFGHLRHIVDWPTGFAGKSLDVDRDDFTRVAHDNDVYRLLVPEGEVGVRPKPVKHGQHVKFRSKVGVICRHLLLANGCDALYLRAARVFDSKRGSAQ